MLTELYKNLIESDNKYDRLDGWFKVEYLVNVLGFNELKKRIKYYEELLCDNDLDIVLHAWQLLPKLLKLGLVQKENVNVDCFERALREGDINSWWIGIDLYKEEVIDKGVLEKEINYFVNSLSADPLTRLGAWSLLPEMLRLGFVKHVEDEKLTELLKDEKLHYQIRLNVFYLILDLYKQGIIKNVDWNDMRKVTENPMFKQLSEAYEKNWLEAIKIIEEKTE